ncbi:unnamed protein product [Caenorhabditis sp. 36 PRJEB53466]|nr:unnamed protein product [Caenorhabditis sp. 36 PRJEB53466]
MRHFILFVVFTTFQAVRALCPCNGIVVEGSDQEHCWQIETRDSSDWTGADDACVAVGGHLGHLDDSTTFESILSYVQKNSDLPVITGIVAADLYTPVYVMMCQNNNIYSTINDTTDVLFSNDPTENSTCTFLLSNSTELAFYDCNITANVLCDRPLESQDYCSIMANCSSTTTSAYSTTTSGVSNVSAQTNSSSSAGTGGSTSSLVTLTSGALSSTTEGSASACTCPSTDTTTVVSSSSSGACSEQDGCLKHQWKIIGMCVDWRAILIMLAIGLLCFLCCCICHFCLHACMFCTPRPRREKEDPVLPSRSVIAPIPLAPKQQVNYDVEKSDVIVLPPTAIQPEPVIITVPEKHESVYGFHTKEIIHMMPERPMTREIGTMTDPLQPEIPAITAAPAPVIKRKKAIKKPKKMFIPATAEPMDSIEEDAAAEIAIDMPQSPGARSVAPLGDAPDMIPLNFSRNPKPMMPEGKIPHDEIQVPPRRDENGRPGAMRMGQRTPEEKKKPDDFDPSGLRSPPLPTKGASPPKRMTFSPIADESDEETGARIPSPPRERKSAGPKNNGGLASPNPGPELNRGAMDPKPTMKNRRLNEMASPTPGANPPAAKSPISGGAPASNNPFASLGGPSPAPAAGAAGGMPNDDVGMRAARGRLGGAVRGGGGGGEAPTGWKPWAKGGARR